MSARKRGRVASRVGGEAGERPSRQKANEKTAQYLGALDSDSDEDGGLVRQNFCPEEKLDSTKYPQYLQYFVKEMTGDQVNLAHFQKSGFSTPILIKEKSGLGMTAPDGNFSVTDVKNFVGARRIIDVMDCATQKNSEMTMKDWEEYYTNAQGNRTKRLNVISLEFSYTKLEPYVIAPLVVRQVDWTDNIWPRHLKEQQTEGTNDMREMMYPKVQKYCLMSVAGCYTDFHIDFGGTSVWYHIIKGKKVFWLIPPTEVNLKAYQNWTLSGRQGDVFFGDLVEKCGMITLESGNTFFIPSGWIHAVYTPEDSLVFGGNFLHSYAIEKQIRIAQIEEMTKVPQKFRFPYFTELQWYALDKYVYALLGRSHLQLDNEALDMLLGSEEDRQHHLDQLSQGHRHITPQELFGLKAIIMYIHALAVSKKNVPALIREPINLVRDVRLVVEGHKEDDSSLAVTGQPLLFWPGIKNDRGYAKIKPKGKKPKDYFMMPHREVKAVRNAKVERMACKICQACISPDCTKCEFCADMIRFGGPGKLRKPCLLRQCLQPLLPLNLCCRVCDLDGWYAEPNIRLVDRPPGTCALMECCFCFEVSHPTCLTDYGVEGYIKMDLPNSWECPKCIKAGLASVKSEEDQVDGSSPAKVLKTEVSVEEALLRKPVSSGSDANFTGYQLFSVKGTSDQPKHVLRTQLAEQIMSASTKEVRKPHHVFRPPPLQEAASDLYAKKVAPEQLNLEKMVMLPVFQKLSTPDLSQCAVVCKSWNRILQDPSLWSTVRLSNWKITSHLLSLIVQRQPLSLILDWSTISKLQLTWLLPRIPQTRSLSLTGIDYASTVIALATVNAPMLQELDLSHVSGFNDSALYKILSPPRDSRPGLLDKKSRLKLLKKLCLSGTEVSDVSLRYIAQYLTQLSDLRLSHCWKVSDAGLAQLSSIETLTCIDVSSCKMVTNQGIHHLTKCNKSIRKVNCTHTNVTVDALKKFVEESPFKLKIHGHVIEEKKHRN